MLYLIYTRQITIGQFFSLFIYSFFIFGPLQELGTVINTYRETEASLDVFQAILATPVEARPANARGPVTRRAPRRRTISVPGRAHPGSSDGHRYAAQWSVPWVRRSHRVRGGDAGQPGRRRPGRLATRAPPPLGLPALGDMTPTQQILRESVAGQEVLDRAAEAAEFERTRSGRFERSGGAGRGGRRARRPVSVWRWPGTARASPAVARSSSRAWSTWTCDERAPE